MVTVKKNFSYIALILLTVSCATPPKYSKEIKVNPLWDIGKQFSPKFKPFNHSRLKELRLNADCDPHCPLVDIWQYQYKPSANSPIVTSKDPISTKKKYWKSEFEARIISATLFGNNKIYLEGLLGLIKSAQYIKNKNNIKSSLWGYETFTFRVYVAKRNPERLMALGSIEGTTAQTFIDTLLELGCEIAYVDNGLAKVGLDATYWRFMVAAEKMPKDQFIRYLVRDADWVITALEAYALSDWIVSGLRFNRLQILPSCIVPVAAGTWGGRHKGESNPLNNMKQMIESFPYKLQYGDEEIFLENMVWSTMLLSGSILTSIAPQARKFPLNLVSPYKNSCQEPTKKYCSIFSVENKCKDQWLPEYLGFALNIEDQSIAKLKRNPNLVNLHLNKPAGRMVEKVLSKDFLVPH